MMLQSTSLLRGKTWREWKMSEICCASIHFPLAREDIYALVQFDDYCASIHFPLAREDGEIPVSVPK